MRTTLNIDEDVLKVAKSMALTHQVSVGEALSDLARKGINTPVTTCRDPETGWLMFDVPLAKKIDPVDVQRALDEDDLAYAKYFRKL
ncbi:MAG: antitoxin [Acidobacteria bacterium]|nr:antitoxin [Acidobacteriota bacterium]